MNNQHAGLSQVLAEQRMTQRREQAADARLARGVRPPRRRRRWAVRGWWQLARWPAATAEQPARRSGASVDRSEVTMSRRARALILGVALVAINLAGMTAVAQAHTTADPASQRHRALGQVEFLATADHAVAAQEQPTDAVEQFRRGERASQEQTTTDNAIRAGLAQERYYSTWGYGDTPAPVPAEPSGQPDWLIPAIGVLAAVLALVAGLVVLAARRAGRRVRAGQAA
jgi:hypothetical protein